MRKILIKIITIEFLIVLVLSCLGIKVESDIVNVVGILILLIAPCMLLLLIGRDRLMHKSKRIIAIVVFLGLVVSFVLASFITLFDIQLSLGSFRI